MRLDQQSKYLNCIISNLHKKRRQKANKELKIASVTIKNDILKFFDSQEIKMSDK
jgi:transposase-like protein